jgi:hypothetical protein
LERETGGILDDRAQLHDGKMLTVARLCLRHVGSPCRI